MTSADRTGPAVRRLGTMLSLTALVLAGCTVTGDPVTSGPSSSSPDLSPNGTDEADVGRGAADGRRMLRPFDSCDALRSFYVDQATPLVGPYGFGSGHGRRLEGDVSTEMDATGSADDVTTDAQSAGGQDVSGTNVQEEGVDEPDQIKTDGSIIVTVYDRRLSIVDVDTETVAATLPLPTDSHSELLLNGNQLLVLSNEGLKGPVPVDGVMAFPPSGTIITRIDVSDPAAPEVLGSVRMEGAYRSARMIDGAVRLVLVSDPPGLRFVQPGDGGLNAEQEALDQNRQILAESDIDDWVPHLQVIDAEGQAGQVRRLMDCTQVNQPGEFAGLSTLSVVTFDLAGEEVLEPTSSAGLAASGDTVYASTDRLIVATSPWGRWVTPFLDQLGRPDRDRLVTDLHSFDIGDPSQTSYVASGTVEGTVIGQFALSEADGVIRVATTTEARWSGFAEAESQSSLIVLAEQGEELVETGRLDGLGVTERIQSVRFLGPDLAAVVTFRQTDPLYLIDTSDPAVPALLGELKIPGFSSYLHPVGEGYLLGVGQDADKQTGMPLGLQVSMFDIRDASDPQRVAEFDFGPGYSTIEHDHRAFLYWPPTGQVIVPTTLYESSGEPASPNAGPSERPTGPFVGAAVLKVGDGDLVEQGRITSSGAGNPDFEPVVVRSLVIDDDLWTLSYTGLAKYSLDTLEGGTEISLL